MKFAHIISRFTSTPWLIREESLSAIARVLEARVNGGAGALALDGSDAKDDEDKQKTVDDAAAVGVGIVNVSGILGKRLSAMESACGGCDYDAVVSSAAESIADPATRAVIMVFDTPGGTVVGCAEAHGRLVALCESTDKPVVAFTETECCSAGYWLASACDAIYSTPSATVGSTGAKAVIRDESEALAKAGIKFHVFKSGDMKDMAAKYRAPTEAEAKLLQGYVDAVGEIFRADVTAQRPGVAAEAFETAAFYTGAKAQELGLVDELVPGIEEVVEEILSPAGHQS